MTTRLASWLLRAHPQPTSAEQTVLLACALADRQRAAPVLTQTLPAVGDWPGLQGAALHHGVAAILYQRIVESGSAAVPAEHLEALRVLAVANERRSLRMSGQLLRVVDVLTGARLDALPMKGPVLSETLYGDPGLRHSADLDIAVRPRDVIAARDALLVDGFEQITGVAIGADRLLASECEVAFKHPDREFVLDLHWRLGPRFARASLPVDDLMAGAHRATFLGRNVLALSREDLFLAMCVHGAHTHQRWSRLELVTALGAWATAAAPSDWSLVFARAVRFGCLRRCVIACLLLRDVAEYALPAEAEAHLARDPLAAHLARVARESMFAHGLQTSLGDGLGGIVWESLALDSPAEMTAHFVARLVTPGTTDWESERVPKHLPRLYYLSRMVRLTLRHLTRGDPG